MKKLSRTTTVRILFILFILMLDAYIIGVNIVKEDVENYYYYDIDYCNDTLAFVTLTDVNGEVMVIIDDNIYRHGNDVVLELITPMVETQPGMRSLMEASEWYYDAIDEFKR